MPKSTQILGTAAISLAAFSIGTMSESPKDKIFDDVKVLRVYDGDTFYVSFETLPDLFGSEMPVRILGIDTAEIKGTEGCVHEEALNAKRELEELLSKKPIRLYECSRDKYFRGLCKVKNGENIDVTDYMIAKKLAVPYNGETKKAWSCKI